MNIGLIKLLASISGLLLLILAAEWFYAGYSKSQLFDSLSSTKEPDYKPGELPKLDLNKRPEDSYSEMVSKPLFVEGRKPVVESDSQTEQAKIASENFEWELTGVYSHKNTKMAMFNRTKKVAGQKQHAKVMEGADIEGWKLVEVLLDRVKLDLGGRQKELMLRKPKPKDMPGQRPPVATPPQDPAVEAPEAVDPSQQQPPMPNNVPVPPGA